MLTGLIPQQHGVYSWRHDPQFDVKSDSLLSFDQYNTYLKANRVVAGMFEPAVTEVWSHAEESHEVNHVPDLEPPFVFFTADAGGHAPYDNGQNYDSADAFFADTGDAEPEEIREFYRRSVDNSARRFQQTLDALEDRGLRDETLVIVTSDHGEHLYDYGGLVGHLHPVTPELVNVPTVVYPPDGEALDLPPYVQHIDLVPTVADVLDAKLPNPTTTRYGQNVFDDGYETRPATNLARFHPNKLSEFGDPCIYSQQSVWDEGGGHVFNQFSAPLRVFFYVVDQLIERKAIGGQWQGLHPSSLREHAPLYLQGSQVFGAPSVDVSDATEILEMNRPVGSEVNELSKEAEDRLEEMGYI